MNVTTILHNRMCLGCGLCSSDVGEEKLRMLEQEDGFLIPVIQKDFDGEVPDLREYCPGITVRLRKLLRNRDEKFYGPFLTVKTAYATDEVIRFRGSSGGCLTAILCGLLEKNLVDGALQVGPSIIDPLKSEYHFSRGAGEVIANAGSRYAPASLLVNLKNILKENNRIAVVGKPCDIAALTQFIEKHPGYSEKIYCTLSFMCMGLPSQNATIELVKRLGVTDLDKISSIRYRGCGWPGQATIVTNNGEEKTSTYHDSWGGVLGRAVHFRCKICPDGWGSFADISAGDAWFTDGKGPLFDEKPGRSLLFIRSQRGQEIISALAGYLAITDYDINELPIIQKSQHMRKQRIWISYMLIKALGDRVLKFRGLGIWSCITRTSSISILREAYGFLKRFHFR